MIIKIIYKIVQGKNLNIKKMNRKVNPDILFRKDKAITKFQEFLQVKIKKNLI